MNNQNHCLKNIELKPTAPAGELLLKDVEGSALVEATLNLARPAALVKEMGLFKDAISQIAPHTKSSTSSAACCLYLASRRAQKANLCPQI